MEDQGQLAGKKERFFSLLTKTETWMAGAFVLVLSLLPVTEKIVRSLNKSGIPNAAFYLSHLVIWISFLAGMIASREREHLSLAAGWQRADKRLKTIIHSMISITGAAFCFGFALAALSFILQVFDPGQKIGFVSYQVVTIIMPIGFLVMGIRFLTREKEGWPLVIRAFAGVFLGLFFGLSPLSNILLTILPQAPDFLYVIGDFYFKSMYWLKWGFLLLLLACGLFGAPIFIIMGGLTFILFSGHFGTLEAIPNEAYNLLTDSSIPAIPLFIFAGFLLTGSKAGERLVKAFQNILGLFYSLTRRIFSRTGDDKALKGFPGFLLKLFPAGLVVIVVGICAIFTSITGASGVTILALGGLLSYVLTHSGKFSDRYTQGLITSSGSIGIPLLPIMMYGVVAQYNIAHLLWGSILPAALMIGALILTGYVVALRRRDGAEVFESETTPGISETLKSIGSSLGEMLLPAVLLVLVLTGITDLVGAASITVLYVFVLEVFIHRDLKLTDLYKVLAKYLPIIGGVLVILAMAKAFSNYLIDAGVATLITEFFQENVKSKIVFLIVLNIILLITGCLMDIYSAILVVAPLIIPLGVLYGIHPVHLGMIFLCNLGLGYLTPPVGLNLFMASYAFKKPLTDIYKGIWPFLLILLVAVLLITFFPAISLVLIPR